MAQLAKEYTAPEQVLFNSTELATPADQNTAQALIRRQLGQLWDELLLGGLQLRTMGDALEVTADGATMDLTVTGLAPILWKLTADPGTPDPQVLLHMLGADDTFTVDAADGSNPRIDIFSAKVETADLGDSETRVFKDGATGTISSQSFDKRRRTKLTITYTPGTPAGSPVAPSTPAGEVLFASVLVGTGVTVLDQANVTDLRSVGIARWRTIPVDRGARGEPTSATLVFDETEMELAVDATGGATSVIWGISCEEGERITDVQIYVRTKSATGDILLSLIENDRSAGGNVLKTGTAITAAGTASATPDNPVEVDPEHTYYVYAGLPAETINISQVRVKVEPRRT